MGDKTNKLNEDLILAVNSRKGDVADVIGMPDEADYEKIRTIFEEFEKQYPGQIKYTTEQGRQDYMAGLHRTKRVFDRSGRAIVNKDSDMEYAFELPTNLVTIIERSFPSMFRSKKHFEWFKDKFSKLMIGEK